MEMDFLEDVQAIQRATRRATSAMRAEARGWDWGRNDSLIGGIGQVQMNMEQAGIDRHLAVMELRRR